MATKKEAAAAAAQTETPATPAAPVTKQGAAIVLESGEKRVDYIRRRFAEGVKRGEIAKELGVKYQVVFAATKQPKAPEGEAADAQA